MSSLSLDGSAVLPARPGYGTEGQPITVYANYVQLVPSSDLTLYSYDVAEIKPEVVGKKRTQIIRLLINESPELEDYRGDMVTDFKSTLISRKQLDLGGTAKVIEVTYKAEGEDEPKESAPKYKVSVKYTKTLTVGDLMSFLTSTNPSAQYDSKLEMIQGLNIFLKHWAKSNDNVATIGASKTFSMSGNADKLDLGRGLTALRGFFTSVRAATNRILVNVNVSHGAFYNEGKLTDLMTAYSPRPDTSGFRSLEKFLKRVRVRTTHLKVKKNRKGEVVHRAKTIFGLAKKSDGQGPNRPRVKEFAAGPKHVEFWLEDRSTVPATSSSIPGAEPSQAQSKKKGKGKGAKGKAEAPAKAGPQPASTGTGHYISVYDHFKNTYNIICSDEYPVINVGTDKNPSYLPAEVCVVLPGQSAMAKLSGDQTRNMIRFAVRGPWLNAMSIVNDGLLTGGLSTKTNPLLVSPHMPCNMPRIVHFLLCSIECNTNHTSGTIWHQCWTKLDHRSSPCATRAKGVLQEQQACQCRVRQLEHGERHVQQTRQLENVVMADRTRLEAIQLHKGRHHCYRGQVFYVTGQEWCNSATTSVPWSGDYFEFAQRPGLG